MLSPGAVRFLTVPFIGALLGVASGALAADVGPASTGEAGGAAPEEAVDFARDVRPILSDRCFTCHGPDAGTRTAGLRLDERDAALAELGTGARAIVPGDVEESELIYRVTSDDAFDRMPPPHAGDALSADEVATLERWIAAGARWGDHWSFVPPRASTPPRADVAPIDAFVLDRLTAAGLQPVGPANAHAQLRRASLDLTGLPPTPEERRTFADAAAADGLDSAYTDAVERLLASPRYGEHMARGWLDAARYADTHGLHLDNRRSIWPYRDWVVRALNDNLPFDVFTRKQLAGDLLPDPTQDDLVATGFNRCNPTSAEGGMIEDEYRSIYAKDRADTTATVWLGLTLACAQCHDHKFDPVSQRDYYSMYAFFNSLDEGASDQNIENPAPYIHVMDAEARAGMDALEGALAKLDARVDAPQPEWEAREARWIAEARADEGRWAALVPEAVRTTGGEDVAVDAATGIVDVGGANPEKTVYELDLWVPPGTFQDLRLDALCPDGRKAPGRADNENFVLTYAEADVGAPGAERETLGLAGAVATWDQPNWGVAGVTDPNTSNGWAGLQKDGDRSAFLRLARPVVGGAEGTEVTLRLRFESAYPRHALARLRVAVHRASGVLPSEPLPLELALVADEGEELAPRVAEAVRVAWRRVHAPDWADDHARRGELRAERKARLAALPTTLVSKERSERRPAHVQRRGAYDSLGEEVQPDVPGALPPLPAGARRDRLGLADWIVSPDNPLTARVQVNRAWQHFFGRGLVATPEDFGAQGAWPTHPALLDWLSVRFVESGWDVKGLHREIVLSDAYRRSSAAAPALRERDPDNALLARGPRHRLDAEVLRDSALYVAGLLDETVGGPGVRPYQPEGVWYAVGYTGSNTVRYERGPTEHLYRRSLYTFWKRTAPPPNLAAFDAPMREACVVARERTNTPLQALVTLNDPTYVEAARFLAQRELLAEPEAADTARAARILERVLARPARAPETRVLAELARSLRAEYAERPGDAAELVGVGELASDESIDIADLAAWTLVASAVLNLDEALTKE